MPSYQRLKTMARQQIRRLGRATSKPGTKELRQEYWSRVTKGRKVSVETKVGDWYQWKATGQCSKDSCSFSHGNTRGQQNKHNRSLLLQRRRHRLTEEDFRKSVTPREKKVLKAISRVRRVIIVTLPCVKITNLNRDANSATSVH